MVFTLSRNKFANRSGRSTGEMISLFRKLSTSRKQSSAEEIKMTWRLPYLIPFLFSLVFTSKVTFEYNTIASYRRIGMVCSVKDREERSLIKIQQGAMEKVTMTSGCVIKSNDTRLSLSCIQTGNDVMLSVNLSYPGSSDMGVWNCSDGNSYDTVTFQDFLKDVDIREFQPSETTFKCIVHEDCHLSLPLRGLHFLSSITYLSTMDGKKLLKTGYAEPLVILDEEWRRKIVMKDNTTYPYLTFMLLDVDISNAGIYYLIGDRFMLRSAAAFIIKITEYPKQPAIILRNLEAESKLGPYKLYCASESKSQPMFTRKPLSFTWRLNGHNLTDLQPCFSLSGPILTLCMDACGLGADANISVTCTAEEDGLVSDESQPFIVPVSRVISEESARGVDTQDDEAEKNTGTLVGACLGSFIIGVILSISLKVLVAKRGGFCKKEHRREERRSNRNNDTLYVNSVMADAHNASENEVRQYEVLDYSTTEHCPKQYDVIYSKGSRRKHK